MPTEQELEELTTNMIDMDSKEMVELIQGGKNDDGRQTESVKVMGAVAVSRGSDCVSGENVLQD